MNDSTIQSTGPREFGDTLSYQHAAELRRSPSARDRLRGVLSLAGLGSQGLDLLSMALSDRNRKVQLAAATVLGEIGDPRAVPALQSALRRCMIGGSGARQIFWARAARGFGWVASLVVVVAIGPFWQSDSAPVAIPVCLVVAAAGLMLGTTSFAWAQRRENLRNAILVALCRIAENGGGREVKSCLPDLEALAESRWGQSAGGRAGLGTVLQYFQTLPDPVPHPIPAEAWELRVGALPLPGGDSGGSSTELPLQGWPPARGSVPLPAAVPATEEEGST